MRSETLLPLLQFVNWWGFNPWYVAGIDRYGQTTISPVSKQSNDQCVCMFQNIWDSNKHWSRNELVDMLEQAEEFFLDFTGYYPAPFYIEGEEKSYNLKTLTRSKLKSVSPTYSCFLHSFGAMSLELSSNKTLVREDAGILDDFSLSFVVPLGTTAEEIRVYFTKDDGDYSGIPEFNERLFQIRPINILVDGVNATFSAPAYLFKKPEYDENVECLPHEPDTYVETVDIYLEVVDSCDQGYFIGKDPCLETPCEENENHVCFTTRKSSNQFVGEPYPADCNDNDQLAKYCLTYCPHEIRYNYLTGLKYKKGLMDKKRAEAISKLALGLNMADKDACDCDVTVGNRYKYLRETPKAINERDIGRQEFDTGWQVILGLGTVKALDGLPPYNGILQALRTLRKNDCNTLRGSRL